MLRLITDQGGVANSGRFSTAAQGLQYCDVKASASDVRETPYLNGRAGPPILRRVHRAECTCGKNYLNGRVGPLMLRPQRTHRRVISDLYLNGRAAPPILRRQSQPKETA